ncbi:predicted protein [Enterococcus gallinarum EG2]|nr:predicted protein [Enterococcus gallinarum EG2]
MNFHNPGIDTIWVTLLSLITDLSFDRSKSPTFLAAFCKNGGLSSVTAIFLFLSLAISTSFFLIAAVSSRYTE